MNGQNNRRGIVEAITSPLGFYVLALLIIESFLWLVCLKTDISIKMNCIKIGTLLFGAVVLIVTYLVIKYPKNLTFGQIAHLIDKGKIYGMKGKERKKKEINRMSPTNVITTKIDNKDNI